MKTKVSHTPGPWEVRPSSNPKNGTGWRDIVSMGGEFSPAYVGEAIEEDANLIAAAPEQNESLQRIKNSVVDMLDALRSDEHRHLLGNPLIQEIAAALGTIRDDSRAAIAKATEAK